MNTLVLGNPTREALETLASELEGGVAGFAFSSGMAAITTVLSLFSQGDHLIFTDDVYGGTYRLLVRVLNRFGIEATFVDTTQIEETEKAIRPNTRGIYVETPTNPLLKITDLTETARLAEAHSLLIHRRQYLQYPLLAKPIGPGSPYSGPQCHQIFGGTQ